MITYVFGEPNVSQEEAQISHHTQVIEASLSLYDIPTSEHETIINEMMNGASERPVDGPGEIEISAQHQRVIDYFSYIFDPLLNIGLDCNTAARIVSRIASHPETRIYLEDRHCQRLRNTAICILEAA